MHIVEVRVFYLRTVPASRVERALAASLPSHQPSPVLMCRSTSSRGWPPALQSQKLAFISPGTGSRAQAHRDIQTSVSL